MAKLTKRVVDASIKTAVEDKRETLATCSTVPGFYVRVKPTGVAHYYFRYRWGGARHRIALGRHGAVTVDDARAAAQAHATTLMKGEDPKTQRQAAEAAPTMDTLADEYMAKHAKPFKKSWAKDESRLRLYIRPRLGALRVAAVTRDHVRTVLTNVGKTHPGAANKVLALLSKMFSLAVEWGYRLDNPCKGLSRSAKKGGAKFPSKDVHHYLSADEIGSLLDALGGLSDAVAAAAIRWIMYTGCRHDEALSLRWSNVDAERGRVKYEDTKTGDQWRPVAQAALDVLHDLDRPEVGDAFVFPSPRSPHRKRASLYHQWEQARETAELGSCRLHDLRHTAASLAAANGASLSQIGAMLGHKSPQATFIYAHLVDADVRAVANGVGDAIAAASKAAKGNAVGRPRSSSLQARQDRP